jgi:dTDP-4-dehydrorhamnose 3,5-epimerase
VSGLLNKIKVTKLSRFSLDSGDVLHAIKNDDPGYIGMGEVYFSFINPKAVKAWKLHYRMTLNLVVPLGMVRFVFLDPQNPITSRVQDIGEQNYARLTVPPGIWFGFKGLSDQPSMVTNIADLKHDPNEVTRKSITHFGYEW